MPAQIYYYLKLRCAAAAGSARNQLVVRSRETRRFDGLLAKCPIGLLGENFYCDQRERLRHVFLHENLSSGLKATGDDGTWKSVEQLVSVWKS